MTSRILLRRGTAAQWASANPILGSGELGVETDTLKFKIGNGTSTWTQLTSYANITPSDLTSAINGLINAAPSALDTLNELAAAINNDSSFSTTVNNLLSGKVSKSGGDIITAATASTTPLAIKAAASQTADLLVWQNNSGAVLAKTDSTGSFTGRAFNASGYVSINSSGGTYTNYWCKLADLTLPGQYTDANLYMDFYINGPGFTYVPRGKLFVRVKQQAPLASAPETPTIIVYNGEGNSLNASDFALVAVQNDSSLTKYELYYKLPFDWAALVYNPTSSVGLVNFYNTILPIATLPSGTKTYGRNSDGKFNSIAITPDANNAINLIVKPIAGQTYNLTEWQNSGGGIVSYVTSSGAIASNTAITATSFVKNGGTASQFLKADGSTDSSSYLNLANSYVAGHHPEGRFLANAALMNDLGNARLRGSTFTFTNISPSNSDLDLLFDGTASFIIFDATTQTFPIVIEFTLPRTLSWGAQVGVGFGMATWRANSVKIEAFSNGAWVTCIDTTTNTSEDVLVGIPGSNSSGTTKLRYTFANPNSTQFRIAHLWAFNYNSDMWSQIQMPRAGGTMYGALSTKGAISVLNSSNTAMSYLNQDGSGALAATDSFGGIGWNIYGNLGVRTSGASGGQGATVTIGSMTQLSSTAALTLYGHVEFGSLTNSAPIQTWSKSDGTLLAKVDQFGAFTVNINSASSVPLTLKAASSQTANIQEWKNSANVVKLAVDANGFIKFDDQTSSPMIKWGNATVWESVGGTASMRINPYGPGYIGLIVKGYASQTADLQQWQDSAGTVLTKVNAYGRMTINSTVDAGGAALYVFQPNGGYGVRVLGSGTSGAALWVDTAAGGVGAIIRGAASQTANLQQWQNSSGTVLTKINSNGALSLSNATLVTSESSNVGDKIGLYSNVFGFGIDYGRTVAFVSAVGDAFAVRVAASSGTASFGSDAVALFGNGSVVQTLSSASTVGLIIKGAASQTANLQEWQNSAGTVLAKIGASGLITASNGLLSSNGLTGISTAGELATGFTYVKLGTASDFATASSVNFGALVSIGSGGNASFVPLAIRGSASQTANLQEWQASNGTVYGRFNAFGSLYVSNNTEGGTAQFGNTGFASASSVVLKVKGSASQTADLQQWQNSAGTVLSRITSSGFFVGNCLDLGSFGQLYQVGLYANQVPVVVSGANSQTADLQEWRSNQSSAAVAKIDVNGNFKGGVVYNINNQVGTSYTFVLSDSKAVVILSNANNITASIPTNSTPFPIGSSITIVQLDLGQVTIQALTPGTTSILSNAVTPTAPRLRGIGSSATLIKASEEAWIVIGDIY